MKNNKTTNNKTLGTTLALILMLTVSSILVVLPAAFAQPPAAPPAVPKTKQSYAFIGAVPNPVGVNQPVLLHVGITDSLQLTEHGFEGLTVTVTKPDGSTETIGPYRTDSTGGTGAVYTPSMAGTYTLVTNFPAQWYNYTGFGMFGPISTSTYFEASTSEPLELIVDDSSIEYYSGHSIPNEYWTRPIDAQLREWSTIAGNWLSIPDNRLAPYNEGPETPHVLWRTKLTTGGLVGGDLGEHAYESGDAYEGFFSDSIILGGVLYYNKYKSGYPVQEVVAVELHTGEELWCKTLGDNERIAFGQNFYWDSYNYHGTFDYLWTIVGASAFGGPAGPIIWNAYDPVSGEFVYSMVNVPSGIRVTGSKGEFYIYTVDTMNGWMSLWNSSRVVSDGGSWMGGFAGGGYGPFDATLGIEWNITLPNGVMGTALDVLDDRIIGTTMPQGMTQTYVNDPVTFWGINIETGKEGSLLFSNTWIPPAGNLSMLYGSASLEDGVFVYTAKEITGFFGFDLNTGEQIWGPTEPQSYLDAYSLGESRAITRAVNIAYGKLFSCGVGGIMYCYDVTTGQLLWSYNANDQYSEILWANNWWINTLFITDGKIYMVHDEHSPLDPKPRGAPFICLDVETGDEVFRIDGAFRGTQWGGSAIIGDSIIATMNTYDQQVYAVGKGPSSTTVSINDDVISLGNNALLTGTVMDMSPGTENTALKLRFPDGVPAISDEDMSEWMLHVYMQFEKPTDIAGVPVRLEAIDPNGNYQYLDTVVSDMNGFYSFMFAPEIEGKYTIMATFEGSEAYYGSFTQTALGVDPAPTPSTPIDTEKPVDTETPVDTEEPAGFVISTEIAIITAAAVAVIIGVAYFLLKRK